MRKCSKCQELKEETEFNFKNRKLQKLANYCKICQRQVSLDHYRNNSEVYKTRAIEYKKVNREKNREYVLEYLKTHSCIDCNETNIIVLDFDHRDPDQKSFSISKALGIDEFIRLDRLKAEINKCDIRCANCHRKQTAKQFGSWRLRDE